MKKLFIVLAILLASAATDCMAVPAKPVAMPFAQPDGSVVMLRKTGDERRHVTTTLDGYPVLTDAAGYWRFATLDEDGRLAVTGIKAASLKDLSDEQRQAVEKIDVKSVKSKLAAREPSRLKVASRASSSNGIGLIHDSFLGYTELKGLVILAQYTDVKFASGNDREFFDRMLNEDGFNDYNGTGSARDYFIEQSMGKFTPHFDVYGPVTLPNKMSYYGANDANDDDKNPEQMIIDACKGLDSQINFKDYDIDGDGYVDNVFVFYAGYGEASYGSDDSVWPHQWELSSGGKALSLDGVKIDKYACSNELEKDENNRPVPDGIGTFVHEFSHVLGLPDLYDTSGNDGSWTPSSWSVLDMGPYNNDGRTPPCYSAYERNALGWIDPVVIDGATTAVLEDLRTTNRCYIIPTSKDNEFFLLENRQQTGWDKYLPGHGMLVWHIDYNSSKWESNSVNNTRTHNYVDLVEACGKWYDIEDYVRGGYYDWDAYDAAIADYAFPGPKFVTSWTDTTVPSMKTWSGATLGLPVTDIDETKGVISFNVAGGKIDTETPVSQPASEVGADYFVASWRHAEGAAAYYLTVTALESDVAESTETADFGSSKTVATLPQGWEFIATTGSTYSTNSNYGAASPSLKLSDAGSGFMTCEYDGEVKAISFWVKGQSTSEGSAIAIDGMIGDQWTQIESVVPSSNRSTTVSITDIPSGVKKVRFVYNKVRGNVAIDDVVITYGGGSSIVEPYNALNVGDVTSYRVTGLPASCSKYSYKVSAADASGRRSPYSAEQFVTLGQSTGIESVGVDVNRQFTVDGRQVVYKGLPGDDVNVVDISGRSVFTAKADAQGSLTFSLPSAGLYILNAPGVCKKIVGN